MDLSLTQSRYGFDAGEIVERQWSGHREHDFGYHKMGISCPAFGGSKKTLFLVMEFLLTSRKLSKHGSG
jgi:hypothetical protein